MCGGKYHICTNLIPKYSFAFIFAHLAFRFSGDTVTNLINGKDFTNGYQHILIFFSNVTHFQYMYEEIFTCSKRIHSLYTWPIHCQFNRSFSVRYGRIKKTNKYIEE